MQNLCLVWSKSISTHLHCKVSPVTISSASTICPCHISPVMYSSNVVFCHCCMLLRHVLLVCFCFCNMFCCVSVICITWCSNWYFEIGKTVLVTYLWSQASTYLILVYNHLQSFLLLVSNNNNFALFLLPYSDTN